MHGFVYEFPTFSVVSLSCCDSNGPLGLIISPCHNAADPGRPLFHCGSLGSYARITAIPNLVRNALRSRWKSVHVIHQPPFRGDVASEPLPLPLTYMNSALTPPFRIPSAAVQERLLPGGIRFMLEAATDVPFGWSGFTGPDSHTLFFRAWFKVGNGGRQTSAFFSLTLGRCALCSDGPHWAYTKPVRWSFVEQAPDRQGLPRAPHSCPGDHIFEAEPSTRAGTHIELPLKDSQGLPVTLRASFNFTRCPLNPSGGTLVLHIDVEILENHSDNNDKT